MHMLEFKTVSGLDLIIELIEYDLSNNQSQIVIHKRPGFRVIIYMFYAWPWPVQLVLKIIITHGIGVIMAHHQISLCRREQLSVRTTLRFCISCTLTRSEKS